MLERRVTLRDGEKVLFRPLTLEDAKLYPDFLAEVTQDDLRLRFFAAMREVSHELLDKLIHYDPARAMAFIAIDEGSGRMLGVVRLHDDPNGQGAMAFIAIDEGSGRMLGVVRLHDDPNGQGAEFAILVRSRLKGHGLGWLMMKHMIAYAKDKRLKTVHGQVLAENVTMLQMCEDLGFHIADDSERGVKIVTLSMDEVPAEAMH